MNRVFKHPLFLVLISILLITSFSFFSCEKNDLPRQVKIHSFSPLKARRLSTVDLVGTGFYSLLSKDSTPQYKLYIGAALASAEVVNDTLIRVWIPENATNGDVCLEWLGKKICGPSPFTLLPGNYTQNTFQRLPDYPGKKNRPGSMFAIGKSVYVGMDDFWRFDVEEQKWTAVANMPEWGTRTACFVINNKAYVFGGLMQSMGNGSNKLFEYDPISNAWTQKASLPGAGRMNSLAFTYNGKGYVVGGQVVSGSSVASECWIYDPATNQWQQSSNLPAPVLWEGNLVKLGNLIYIPSDYSFIEFDPSTNSRKIVSGGPANMYCAVHNSSRWEMSYVIGNDQIYRVTKRYDGNMFSQSYMYPTTPGNKKFWLYASAGEELFFMHINDLNYYNEFWEYLPE